MIEQGSDPRAHSHGGPMTTGDLIECYIQASSSKRSCREIERRLRNVLPEIGLIRVSDLHRRDVSRVLDRIMQRGSPSEARHVFIDIRSMLNWALGRGEMETNPVAGMKSPAPARIRERRLSDDEIKMLWNGLPKIFPRSASTVRIIKLALLTGQRSNELCGMRRSELDLAARTWSIPSPRNKSERPHVVPLSSTAIEIIREALAEGASDERVFPGHTSARLGNTLWVARRRGSFDGEPWTFHDLRRTCASGMAALGIVPDIVGRVINHNHSGGSTSVTSTSSTTSRQRSAQPSTPGLIVSRRSRERTSLRCAQREGEDSGCEP